MTLQTALLFALVHAITGFWRCSFPEDKPTGANSAALLWPKWKDPPRESTRGWSDFRFPARAGSHVDAFWARQARGAKARCLRFRDFAAGQVHPLSISVLSQSHCAIRKPFPQLLRIPKGSSEANVNRRDPEAWHPCSYAANRHMHHQSMIALPPATQQNR